MKTMVDLNGGSYQACYTYRLDHREQPITLFNSNQRYLFEEKLDMELAPQ